MFRNMPARSFEQLETRSMLSGHALARLADVVSHSRVADFIHDHAADIAAVASAHLSGSSSLSATALSTTLAAENDSGVTGSAKFISITKDGTATTTFTASIQGGAADTAYDVDINGTNVGTITTNANGAGKLALTGSLAVAVAAGDTVTVSLAGTAQAGGALDTNVGITCGHGDNNEVRLAASLTDTTGAISGTASFKSETDDGTTESNFVVNITGAADTTPLAVIVDGNTVGTITPGANGAGSLTLTNPTFTVNAGSTIAISTATGTFAVGNVAPNVVHLSGSLTDSTGGDATANVNFSSYTEHDGTVESKLAVSVKGAAASTTFNVTVDGTVVGSLTTDTNGNGSVKLKGGLAATPVATSTVAIVNTTDGSTALSGTVSASAGYSGRFDFGFGRRGRG